MSLFITLIILQKIAAIIALIGAIIVVSVIIFLYKSSLEEEDKTAAKAKVYKTRRLYFWGLIGIIVIGLFSTLQSLPYSDSKVEATNIVTAVGSQWAWKMEHGTSDEDPKRFKGEREITIPINEGIKFIVTSTDVSHNFAIYNDEGVLLTQTQAMPYYKNKLSYTFTKKGVYSVICLEYCGILHSGMIGKINVQ